MSQQLAGLAPIQRLQRFADLKFQCGSVLAKLARGERQQVFDLTWAEGLTYRDVHHEDEVQFSKYNFKEADIDLHRELFDDYEKESARLLDGGLVLPAYDYVLKCSHAFNVLDARGAVGVSQRAEYIARVRKLARRTAKSSSRSSSRCVTRV